ncbi:MAG: hypothetical protein DMG58_08140 [Acidobacteria bacterium]|nr:MAG: hypothetical protein DMG58_08140 [Acidobacteriota bacterium]
MGFLFALMILVWPAVAQSQEESLRIYTEHPRLFLGQHRLKLLQKEKERRSLRWQQFELLTAGHAPMPEPGLAGALYYRIAGDQASGRAAVTWALGTGTDLRQIALVFDWCQDLLSPVQSRAIAAKLAKMAALRSRALAAVALADHLQAVSERELERVIQGRWRGEIAPELQRGRDVIPHDDYYPLYEMLHAVRDNLNIDLRESAPEYFKALPIYDLVSYYPATFPAPEGEYRIPASKGGGEPDVRRAIMSRAAELAMVPFDTNAPSSQILQGWLMHDNFLLRSTLGAPYEFLWANPYHPGLSYYLAPLVFHDENLGRLFIRSSWDESARWLGYFDGELQLFENGNVTVLNAQLAAEPMSLDTAVVFFGKNAQKFQTILNEDEEVFVLGLTPRRTYQVEVDDEEMIEGDTDTGGILELKLPHKVQIGVRLHDVRAATPKPRRSAQDDGAGGASSPR